MIYSLSSPFKPGFLLWNTKDDIVKNISAVFVLINKSGEGQNSTGQKGLQLYGHKCILLC